MSRDIVNFSNITTNTLKIILVDLGLYDGKRLHTRLCDVLYNYPQVIQSIINLTSFMVNATDLKTRIHCILLGIVEQPVCKYCSQPVLMRISGKNINTFPTFCNSSCAAKHPSTKLKRSLTNIEKYGVDNLLKIPSNRYKGS